MLDTEVKETMPGWRRKGLTLMSNTTAFIMRGNVIIKRTPLWGTEAFVYQQGEDEYEWSSGEELRFEKEAIRRIPESGYESKRRIYRCVDCPGCPVKGECNERERDRQISVEQS